MNISQLTPFYRVSFYNFQQKKLGLLFPSINTDKLMNVYLFNYPYHTLLNSLYKPETIFKDLQLVSTSDIENCVPGTLRSSEEYEENLDFSSEDKLRPAYIYGAGNLVNKIDPCDKEGFKITCKKFANLEAEIDRVVVQELNNNHDEAKNFIGSMTTDTIDSINAKNTTLKDNIKFTCTENTTFVDLFKAINLLNFYVRNLVNKFNRAIPKQYYESCKDTYNVIRTCYLQRIDSYTVQQTTVISNVWNSLANNFATFSTINIYDPTEAPQPPAAAAGGNAGAAAVETVVSGRFTANTSAQETDIYRFM